MRVAVTTTPDRAERYARPLSRHGLVPLVLPCIAVDPAGQEVLEAVRALVPGADLLVLTSPRTVELLWPQGGMPSVPVAAVGAVTAATVERLGGQVAVRGGAGLEQLVEAIPSTSGRVVFPHAAGTPTPLLERLAARLPGLHHVVVYSTRPVPPPPDPVEAAVFASPSAVEGWLLSRDFEAVIVAAIGDTTAAALRRAGRPPEVVPLHPEPEELARRLAHHLSERRTS